MKVDNLVFRWLVQTREPGDYVDAPGEWTIVYKGKDMFEACDEAKQAAALGKEVRIDVARC